MVQTAKGNNGSNNVLGNKDGNRGKDYVVVDGFERVVKRKELREKDKVLETADQNPQNAGENRTPVEPSYSEYEQSKSLVPGLSTEELQNLRTEIQAEIDCRAQERLRQIEEERIENLYGSATESDSKASDGESFEYAVEEVGTSDLDSDAAENWRILARTMQEGEPEERDTEMHDAEMENGETDKVTEDENFASSSDTSPASSENDDSESEMKLVCEILLIKGGTEKIVNCIDDVTTNDDYKEMK
ncbi:uncharacterized protein LOC113350633 [Papaver somniferum]|uniref:uncharacterized protein LOC113350633 n=1 Tax=Papaver somniferum TaxID=3469 RepID=UPI000E705CCC|nr:uncharacterized protein LOC113350633 [Papaver somniferum]